MGILVVTSRKPCKRTRVFCKELARAIEGASYLVRGKSSLEELLELAKSEKSKIIHVGDYKGNPGKLAVLDEDGTALISILIKGVVLKREQKEVPIAEGKQAIAEVLCSALGLKSGAIKQCNDILFFERGPAIRVRSCKFGSEARP